MTDRKQLRYYISITKAILQDSQWWLVWFLLGLMGYLGGIALWS